MRCWQGTVMPRSLIAARAVGRMFFGLSGILSQALVGGGRGSLMRLNVTFIFLLVTSGMICAPIPASAARKKIESSNLFATSGAEYTSREEPSLAVNFSEALLPWLRRRCPALQGDVDSPRQRTLMMNLQRLAAGLSGIDQTGDVAVAGMQTLLQQAEVSMSQNNSFSFSNHVFRNAMRFAKNQMSNFPHTLATIEQELPQWMQNNYGDYNTISEDSIDRYQETIVVMLPLRHAVLKGKPPKEGLGDLFLATISRLKAHLEASKTEGSPPFLSRAFSKSYHQAMEHCLEEHEDDIDMGSEACREKVGDLRSAMSILYATHAAASSAQMLAEDIPKLGVGEECVMKDPSHRAVNFSEGLMPWLRQQCPALQNGNDSRKERSLIGDLEHLFTALVGIDEHGDAAIEGVRSIVEKAEAASQQPSHSHGFNMFARFFGNAMNLRKDESASSSRSSMIAHKMLPPWMQSFDDDSQAMTTPSIDRCQETIMHMLPLRRSLLKGKTPQAGLGDLLLGTIRRLKTYLTASRAETSPPFFSFAFSRAYQRALRSCLEDHHKDDDLGKGACLEMVGDWRTVASTAHAANSAAAAAHLLAENLPSEGVGEDCVIER